MSVKITMPSNENNDNVVLFTGLTRLDIPAQRVIERALTEDLDNVVVIGTWSNGDYYFAAPTADTGRILYHLERARNSIMKGGD